MPNPTRSSWQQPTEGVVIPAENINAYPNPSNGPVHVVAQLPEGAEKAMVRVMDPLGRMVQERSFSGTVQVIDLDDVNLCNGVYTAGLWVDGIEAGTVKFELVR